jgi:hypothetical protein
MLSSITFVFAAIGFVWVLLFVVGWILNGMQMLVAKDQWLATCLLPGAYADETISAWAHRTHRKRTEAFINWLFNDPYHCASAYVSEMEHTQNNHIYRKE